MENREGTTNALDMGPGKGQNKLKEAWDKLTNRGIGL